MVKNIHIQVIWLSGATLSLSYEKRAIKNPGPTKIPLCGGGSGFEKSPEGAFDVFL